MTDPTGTEPVGIRRVSELTGLSPDTLRWYEREGLLPLVERSPDGRRRYPPAAIGFVRLVQALRRTGMPVEDVRTFVQMGSGLERHEERGAMLQRHATRVEQRIAQLQQDLEVVRAKIEHHRDLGEQGRDCEDVIGAGRPDTALPQTTDKGE